jgi:hypothetical protein
MKLLGFNGDQIETIFAGVDLYKLITDVSVHVNTDEGALHYVMKAGFLTDMRSGSHAIDKIIPKFTKNNQYNLAILVHDFNYSILPDGSHPVSKRLADELLQQMALMSGEIGSFKASLMKTAVKLFGQSAYDCENDDREISNGAFMKFEWGAK